MNLQRVELCLFGLILILEIIDEILILVFQKLKIWHDFNQSQQHPHHITSIMIMSLNNMPEVLREHLVDFLLPHDVHALGVVCPMYKPCLARSLNNSLRFVLKGGTTSFKCQDPLHSFTSMTERLPSPRSVCIR